MKTKPNSTISTHLESQEKGYNYCIVGKFAQKGRWISRKGN
jgi:hypothetical protein